LTAAKKKQCLFNFYAQQLSTSSNGALLNFS